MTEKLLPCPFCGVNDHLSTIRTGSAAGHDYPSAVICLNLDCDDVSGPTGNGEAEANAAWNRRTPAPEGDAVAWRISVGQGPGIVTDSKATAEMEALLGSAITPLYASPVVPVGREEIARQLAEAIYQQVAPLLAECSEPNPEDYINAILAALGTKGADHD